MNRKILAGALCLALVGSTSSVWAVTCPSGSSPSKLKGTFAQLLTGFVGNPPQPTGNTAPEASTGTITADGNGGFTGNLTFNAGGTVCSGTVTGTFCANDDGSGRGTATGQFTGTSGTCPSGGSQSESFTIVGPNRIDFISTDSESVLSGSAIRQNQGKD